MDDTRWWALADRAYRSYVVTLLWANAVCNEESCEDGREIGDCEHTSQAYMEYSHSDFTGDDAAAMQADVEAMIESAGEDFWAYVDKRSAEDFGRDFALTRNGHGTGFWDRGLGELGDRLTALAKPCGEQSVLVSESEVSLA